MNTCRRCGEFLASAPVAGVALCAACLEGGFVGGYPVFTHPPRLLLWLLVRPFTALGAVAAVFISWTLLRPGMPPSGVMLWIGLALVLVSGAYGAFVGEMAGLVFFFLPQSRAPMRVWRRRVLEAAGIGGEDLPLVALAERRIQPTDLRAPVEIGVLAEGEGLAFLGERGSRVAIPAREIVAVGLERIWTLPPRTALRIELRSGLVRYVAFLEGRTWRQNRDAAARLRDRLAARLS